MYDEFPFEKPAEPQMKITLDLREMLPEIRKAFEAKKLQMFTNPEAIVGSYNGPCAVGVCLTKEQRYYGDSNEFSAYSVCDLVDASIFVFPPNTDQARDAQILQSAHDKAMVEDSKMHEVQIKKFEEVLIGLEKKYL